MVGSAVETMVWSSAARNITSIRAPSSQGMEVLCVSASASVVAAEGMGD
jgi:hypothetical protein